MAHDRVYSEHYDSDESDVVVQWETHKPFYGDESNHIGEGYVLLSMHKAGNGVAEETVEAYGHYSRAALNRLIEKLRRARKEAYGEDK